jgi:AhpD family alkylhydroperoxidase
VSRPPAPDAPDIDGGEQALYDVCTSVIFVRDADPSRLLLRQLIGRDYVPRLAIPDGPEKITDRVYRLRPDYAEPAAKLLEAVTCRSILSPREREAVRYRIALINGCLICQSSRSADARDAGFTEAMYAEIGAGTPSGSFTARERLAVEFAERFALDHHSMGDEFFARLKELFSDPEILDLTVFTGRFMAFGRLTHVLGLDDSCELAPAGDTAEFIPAY